MNNNNFKNIPGGNTPDPHPGEGAPSPRTALPAPRFVVSSCHRGRGQSSRTPSLHIIKNSNIYLIVFVAVHYSYIISCDTQNTYSKVKSKTKNVVKTHDIINDVAL